MTPVVELRQYTLKPGRRDEMIALFERAFVETQEAAGIRLIGLFRDLDRPDHFVWMRGFPDMAARRAALTAFYTSDHWLTHRAATNATLIDSDDVLLLRPLATAPAGEPSGDGVVVIGVHPLAEAETFADQAAPRLSAAGLTPHAVLVTETAANDFPRLPVREDARVLVWLSVLPDAASAETALERARADPALAALFGAALQILSLKPTARSRLQA